MKRDEGGFAEALKKAREALGLSQYALAKKSGVTKQALSRLEMGASEPSWQTVQRLALALGVDCRSFINPSIHMPEQPTADAAPPKRGRPKKAETPADAPAEQPPGGKKPRGKR